MITLPKGTPMALFYNDITPYVNIISEKEIILDEEDVETGRDGFFRYSYKNPKPKYKEHPVRHIRWNI